MLRPTVPSPARCLVRRWTSIPFRRSGRMPCLHVARQRTDRMFLSRDRRGSGPLISCLWRRGFWDSFYSDAMKAELPGGAPLFLYGSVFCAKTEPIRMSGAPPHAADVLFSGDDVQLRSRRRRGHEFLETAWGRSENRVRRMCPRGLCRKIPEARRQDGRERLRELPARRCCRGT